MPKITNDFSWSFTRHKTFAECLRQYYYQYYGYWDGWMADAPDRARLTYRLKKMMSLPMWLGDLVHRMIERILRDLRNRELNTLEAYQKQARAIMNREWAASVEEKWRWKPKDNLNLFEHYYGIPLSADDRVAARDKVFRCLRNLLESEIFQGFAALKPEQWRSIEKLDQFVVGEIPVYLKIDCAVSPAPAGAEPAAASAPGGAALAIYDWKTGQETDETLVQLGCYALYGFHVWRVPVAEQRLISYYLDPNTLHEHTPTSGELIDTKDLILSSVEEMTALLDSSVAENAAREENFPMTTRRSTCKRCFFRELCFNTREWRDEAAG